jgi:hypothetical protein
MNQFHLTPKGTRWELSQDGTPVGSFATKEKGVNRSIEIVREVTGTLKIHRADGTIEEERTYPRAGDPLKTPG